LHVLLRYMVREILKLIVIYVLYNLWVSDIKIDKDAIKLLDIVILFNAAFEQYLSVVFTVRVYN